jgi:hypothetical protein
MPFFYNTDAVIDNEYGALDNATLDFILKQKAEEEKKKAEEDLTRNPVTGLSPAQEAAKRAQEEARIALEQAQEAVRAAAAEQARIKAEAAARAKAEAEARARAEAAARAKAEAEARARAEAEARARAEAEARARALSQGTQTRISTITAVPLTPATISSIPSNISPITQTSPPPPVKTALIDTISVIGEDQDFEIMADLIFENIGGQELINIARNDTVNGQQIIYQPIKNLTKIQQEYNPNNIVSLQSTSNKYFQNFSIKFENKVPKPGTGPLESHVYIDSETGDLVIEVINSDLDEQVELEISTGGTIYEAEL